MEVNVHEDFIIDTICEYFGTCRKAIFNLPSYSVKETRHIAIWCCFKYTKWDLFAIGIKLGVRTDKVMYSFNFVHDKILVDPEFALKVKMAENHLVKMHYLVTEKIYLELLPEL